MTRIVRMPPFVVAWCLTVGAVVLAQSTQQQPPVFRTETNLRSVEVRVVDRQGRPITGLRAEDFTVTDNNVRQAISHFVPIALTPETHARGGLTLNRAGTRPADRPSTRRVFLIVLGRAQRRPHNLQIPSKGVDGVMHLVTKLLPQDQVAVLAWNRATPFTDNQAEILEVLKRYEKGHQKIEVLLSQHFSGLTAVYGSRDMPAWIQSDIDLILRGSETRTVLAAGSPATTAVDRQIRRDISALQTTAALDVFDKSEADRIGMSLDEYASNSVQTMQDLTRIYAGLAYLRHIDGEKHLVFVSPTGLGLPSTDDDKGLARMAQDARVAIDIFHTDGMSAGIFAVASSQNIAELTGGQYTGVTYGPRFIDRVDAATRSGYQLGYYPTDAPLDGKYRKVEIEVSRSGAQVLYRHGYFARADLTTLDRRQVISQSRIEAALRYGAPIRDLAVAASATRGKTKDGRHEMVVQVNVAPVGISLGHQFMDRVATLDVVVMCADRQYLVGSVWRTVDLKFEERLYDEFSRRGIGFTVHVPLRRTASNCKAVVYDYDADRLGTAIPKIN